MKGKVGIIGESVTHLRCNTASWLPSSGLMLSAVTSLICIVSIALNFFVGSIFRILERKISFIIHSSFEIIDI